jgi:hypothetical protein
MVDYEKVITKVRMKMDGNLSHVEAAIRTEIEQQVRSSQEPNW